jgi:AcrR family transcriptional regulator
MTDDGKPADGPQADAVPRTNGQLREEATERMLETAIRLIAERGASRLSLVDVGRESGYSHSLPNYYFKTKTRLLLQVYQTISRSFTASAAQWRRRRGLATPTAGLDSVESTVRAYLGLASSHTTRSRAMNVLWAESYSSMPVLLDVAKPLNDEYLQVLEADLRAAVRKGHVDPDADIAAVAVIVLALLRGVVGQHLLDPSRADLPRVADAFNSLLRRGLAPQPGAVPDPAQPGTISRTTPP